MLFVGHNALCQFSFAELIDLQKTDVKNFETIALRKDFVFSHSIRDTILDRITFVYFNKSLDSSKYKLERITDTLHFNRSDIIITTIEFSLPDKERYLQAIGDCKELRYYYFSSYNYDNRQTVEYRDAASVAKFITVQNDGQNYYIISTSHSPK